MHEKSPRPILVLGATGYIGSRLLARLLDAGYTVRALARNPGKLSGRPWSNHPQLQVVRGDLLNPASLESACRGCRSAFYLVHSMNPQTVDFAATDRRAAANLAQAAEQAGIENIIYLSGLGEEHERLSHHLRSRGETGEVLRQGAVPVTILRAAMIIGSGSASFEILRYLVERLPVIVTPRWVQTHCQPIAVRNVLAYLVGCLEVEATRGETFDIGCEEVLSYRDLMRIYAEEAGLPRRLILPVPVLTPGLSAYCIHLVTPVPASLARPLAEGLSSPVLCREHRIRKLIPQELFNCRKAIHLALARIREQHIESTWYDAGETPPVEWITPGDPHWAGGAVFVDARQMLLAAEPAKIWEVLVRIGGDTGWYYADWLWRLRGMMDKMIGGVGIRRGRRDRNQLAVGDALDFWRVARLEPPTRLMLVAEMKLPGEAILTFELEETPRGTRVSQRAFYLPRGLLGLIYWGLVSPFHYFVFNGMLRGIADACAGDLLEGPEKIPLVPEDVK
jgi:uncharacterized protein YbjT (DUF2867 family)